MNKVSFGFALLTLLFISCNKTDQSPGDAPAKATTDDTRSVLLRDIEAENVPAPYFHFEYDSLHYAKKISFASELFVYDVEYENKRVKRMINEPDGNSLIYSYNTNDQVSAINEYSLTGNLLFKYQFSYNAANQLVQAFWYKYSMSGRADLIKRADLTYYADDNLSTLNLYYPTASGELAWSSREEFFDYDNKTNVDDILLLKDFFGSYLFLPQVKLQKNNPTRERITSDVNNYETQNSFDYRNDLPIVKYSLVNQTKGGNGQGPIQVETHYNYY
ncbi:MAG: hypothetical protein ACXVLT_01940 [Flavisolibacter sp.]